MDELMDKTFNNAYYKDLRNNNYTKILGIWDDNDFGVNDGESNNPIKHQQKKRFFKFLEEDFKMSKRWQRSFSDKSRGIEQHYQIVLPSPPHLRGGSAKDLKPTKIRLILPDLRYYKNSEK